ncbi:MAG: hypothetical protein GF330_11470 [Candidatus Eisenbacteria bacterium]|nr:hypothetical protein [Candidatus Eisenbacteria bacterium]
MRSLQLSRHRSPTVRRAVPPLATAAALLLLGALLGAATTPRAQAGSGETPGPDGTQAALELATTVLAVHLGESIVLDGELREAVWQRPSVAPLIQRDPDNGAPPRQPTDWWVAYDQEALYVAARLHDAAPESIACNLGRRDTWPSSDWVFVNLDTFNDDRNGYSFSVNPAGVIGDATIFNDGWTDDSWDPIWDCATRIDAQGWAVEMRIPFSQLAFPDRDEQVWGINFSRRTLRTQERADVIHIPRGESGYCGRFPDLVGIRGICGGRRLELLTYGVGRARFRQVDPFDPYHEDRETDFDLGMDLKWCLSSNLMLNATINPDFGQVEVDPAVVNLSAYETYFSERRPFFVHGANVFRFAQEGTNSNWNFNWMDPLLFYSRRVGRAPSLSLHEHDYAELAEATTILGAGKLSGTLGNSSVGFLTAFTAEEEAELQLRDRRWDQTIEPLANYSVLRLQRTRPDGHRGIGLMATSTLRDLPDERSREELVHSALAGGIDGWMMLDADGEWALKGFCAGSHVHGDAAAIERLQYASRRYYQRPDVDHVAVDPSRTSLAGWVGRAMLNKQSGNVRLNTALGAVSPGFEINDAGFQTRADQINWHLSAGYHWHEPRGFVRERGFDLATYRTWDLAGTPDNYGYGGFYFVNLSNYWGVNGSFFYNPERQSHRYTRGGPAMRLPHHVSADVNLQTDCSKPLCIGVGAGGSRGDEGSRTAHGYCNVHLRPASALRISFMPSYEWGDDRTAWVGRSEDERMTETYGVRYLYSDMEYRELSLTTRIDWTFTPKLTLQAYLQPLFATGDYRDFKEFARAATFLFNEYGQDNGSTITFDAEREAYEVDPDGTGPAEPFSFSNPDFNFKSLRFNAVLRWEYRPGSTLYLVWTQSRTDLSDPGSFDLPRDWGSLATAEAENIVLAKVTRWFDL